MKGLLFAILLLSACKTIEESRDRKALGRVLGKEDLIDRVAKVLPPCANDTTIVVVDTISESSVPIGGSIDLHDSKPVSVTTKIGQVAAPKNAIYIDQLLPNGIHVKLKDGVLSASAKIKTETKVVVDNKLVDKWRDLYVMANDKAVKQKDVADAQIAELKATNNIQKQKLNTRFWIIVSAFSLAAIAIIVAIKK